jgi:hypothetical protein
LTALIASGIDPGRAHYPLLAVSRKWEATSRKLEDPFPPESYRGYGIADAIRRFRLERTENLAVAVVHHVGARSGVVGSASGFASVPESAGPGSLSSPPPPQGGSFETQDARAAASGAGPRVATSQPREEPQAESRDAGGSSDASGGAAVTGVAPSRARICGHGRPWRITPRTGNGQGGQSVHGYSSGHWGSCAWPPREVIEAFGPRGSSS